MFTRDSDLKKHMPNHLKCEECSFEQTLHRVGMFGGFGIYKTLEEFRLFINKNVTMRVAMFRDGRGHQSGPGKHF